MTKTEQVLKLLKLQDQTKRDNLINLNNHLLLKDYNRFNRFLEELIDISNNSNQLLSLTGYYNLLKLHFKDDFMDYIKTLKALEFTCFVEDKND